MTKPIYPKNPVLLVDDEPQLLTSLTLLLKTRGIVNIETCDDSRKVMPLLAEKNMEAVLLDLTMPHVSGMELLQAMGEEYPGLPVIVFTGVNDLETAVSCMRAGAFDYMVKPVESSRLVSVIQRALDIRELRRENALLKKNMFSRGPLKNPETFASIITNDQRMFTIFQYVESIAASPQPVLITGETGVGKELIARALHEASGRRGKFITVNVAGLDDTLFADTLFGHRKGAFTGADQSRKGLVEQAGGGTLFLDEIGDLAADSQTKLLRLLQEREYLPLGSDMPVQSDARILVATNHSLKSLQEPGRFRKDLYYRLMIHQIEIPPLRERKDDIPLLLSHFLDQSAAAVNKKRPTPPPELELLLGSYHFPGNIRELRALVYDAVSVHQGRMLSMTSFARAIHGESGTWGNDAAEEAALFPGELPTLKSCEKLLVNEALKRAQGNQKIAARMLGISRQALNKRLQKTGNSPDNSNDTP